jgi:hypothetical protein
MEQASGMAWMTGFAEGPPIIPRGACDPARVDHEIPVGVYPDMREHGWEPTVLLFPGYLKRATVAYYLQALVTHEMPQDSAVSLLMQVFHEVPSVATSLLCLTVIVGVTLWLAGRAVEGREYVLEQ